MFARLAVAVVGGVGVGCCHTARAGADQGRDDRKPDADLLGGGDAVADEKDLPGADHRIQRTAERAQAARVDEGQHRAEDGGDEPCPHGGLGLVEDAVGDQQGRSDRKQDVGEGA